MSDQSQASVAIAVRRELRVDPREVTHLVCCRQDPWEIAVCGFNVSEANIIINGDICAMCVTTAEEMWRARGGWVDEHCPYDGTPCPSDEWVNGRVTRETS